MGNIRKVTIDYTPHDDKKWDRSISYVFGPRRQSRNNRLTPLYDSVNVYVAINDLLILGHVEIVILSKTGLLRAC